MEVVGQERTERGSVELEERRGRGGGDEDDDEDVTMSRPDLLPRQVVLLLERRGTRSYWLCADF